MRGESTLMNVPQLDNSCRYCIVYVVSSADNSIDCIKQNETLQHVECMCMWVRYVMK